MVKITCDNCGTVKPDKLPATVEWILGYDLETETPKSVQRSIRLLDHWDDRRVLELGAIHTVLAPVPRRVYEVIRSSHERQGITERFLKS